MREISKLSPLILIVVGQPSVTVPVVDGEVLLGRWQRVMFVELDQARARRVFFHVQG